MIVDKKFMQPVKGRGLLVSVEGLMLNFINNFCFVVIHIKSLKRLSTFETLLLK